jgi:molybdopterin-guanine dinucleotide biosynthesis protein A
MYPLTAVYRPSCYKPLLDAFLTGERSLYRVLDTGCLAVRKVNVESLRDVDPQLDSLVNCNTPAEYEHALARARRGIEP